MFESIAEMLSRIIHEFRSKRQTTSNLVPGSYASTSYFASSGVKMRSIVRHEHVNHIKHRALATWPYDWFQNHEDFLALLQTSSSLICNSIIL